MAVENRHLAGLGRDRSPCKAHVPALAAAGPFPNVPLAVVTGVRRPPRWLMPDSAAQLRRTNQVDCARHVLADQSGHFPQLTEPDLVVDAVRSAVVPGASGSGQSRVLIGASCRRPKPERYSGTMVRIPGRVEAVIFDMDGVIIDTASVHAAAWAALFDDVLRGWAAEQGRSFVAFSPDDYRRFVDGRPRHDGVRSFLASRGFDLPEGDPSDGPDAETVCGLGNRKNGMFLARLRAHGARAYASSVALVNRLERDGIATAVISASRNMTDVLDAAGLSDLFEVRVDGVVAGDLGLRDRPEPGVFLEAVRRLGVDPDRAAIVEAVTTGVEAGCRGGFAFVVGVDRTGDGQALRGAGADAVVDDLAALEPTERPMGPIDALPLAPEHLDDIHTWLGERRPAVFLDYDGTLTPIVPDPAQATLAPDMREALERLAAVCPVAVVSGRDLADVRALVGINGLWYAGSHGFDIAGPAGERHERGLAFLPSLAAAEEELRPLVTAIDGARLERKRFAATVHFRQTPADLVPQVEAAVNRVAAGHPDLRRTGGKMIHELRPNVPWDKGRAVRWLLRMLGLDAPDVAPIYVGDDDTDEDAVRALGPRGLGLVVRGERDARPTLARYALDGPADVRTFLEALCDWAAGRRRERAPRSRASSSPR